jgi:hypothetical protein
MIIGCRRQSVAELFRGRLSSGEPLLQIFSGPEISGQIKPFWRQVYLFVSAKREQIRIKFGFSRFFLPA